MSADCRDIIYRCRRFITKVSITKLRRQSSPRIANITRQIYIAALNDVAYSLYRRRMSLYDIYCARLRCAA